MVFGWQGFQFEHPDDWAPASLTGNREEGYARLTSSGKLSCQIRWKQARNPAPPSRSTLETYLSRLQKDFRRSKQTFKYEIEEEDVELFYRYSGQGQAKGKIFLSEPCGRTFFFEVISSGKDSPTSVFRSTMKTFASNAEATERWALLGIDVSLPSGLAVLKKTFQAGRTLLELKDKRMAVTVDRWGFAEQLVRKHDLESWAKSLLAMPDAETQEASCGLKLTLKPRMLQKVDEAIVALQPESNQITVIRVKAKSEEWRPQWDWLT